MIVCCAMDIVEQVTASDLRAALARARVPAYLVAARVRLHPVNLSRILHGHVGLKAELAEQILTAIEVEVRSRPT